MIPKPLREQLGLRVEPIAASTLEEQAGRLVIPATGASVTDDDVRGLRDADQR